MNLSLLGRKPVKCKKQVEPYASSLGANGEAKANKFQDN